MDIPEDVMEAAGGVLRDFMHSPKKGKLTHIIARAIMAERERCETIVRKKESALRGEYRNSNDEFDLLLADHVDDLAAAIRKGTTP